MANTPKAAQPERVAVFVPRGSSKEDPNLYISVNGESYILPKGKTSKVPPHIAYEANRVLEATAAMYDLYDQKAAEGKQPN